MLAVVSTSLFTASYGRLFGREPEPVGLHYQVTVVDPKEQLIEVKLRIEDHSAAAIHLGFSANSVQQNAPVSRFRVRSATDENGDDMSVVRERGIWRFKGSPLIELRYEVHLGRGREEGRYADALLSDCDETGARLLGSDLFLFPLDTDAHTIDVEYVLPDGWDLIHPFQSGPNSASYPELRSLYYSVVAVGDYRELRRIVGDCELILAVRGRFNFGDRDLIDTIARVVEPQIEFFQGGVRPRYVFIVNPHPTIDDPRHLHYFGLHFDASMAILLDQRTDRPRLQSEPAHILAHEFFHNWNGELIRQNDYDMNWFVEGVTTYYSYRSCKDARLLDSGSFAREIRDRYTNYYATNPRRSTMTLAEAGQTVLQDPAITSYLYAGGTLAALSLDDEIKSVSGQRVSLDDLMQELARLALADDNWILTQEELESALNGLTGSDFGPWFARYVYGNSELELPAYVIEDAR